MLAAASAWLLISPDTLIEHIIKLSQNNGSVSDNLQVILVRVESAEYITLCVGLFLVLVGFLGCCGAAKDSKWMLQLFITVLIILILAEVVAPILAFTYYPEIENFMVDRFQGYNMNSTESQDVLNVEFIDQVQSSLRCCGWEDFDDFNGNLPPSCDSLKLKPFY